MREFDARAVPFFVVHDFRGSSAELRAFLAASDRLFVSLSGHVFKDDALLHELHALPLPRTRESFPASLTRASRAFHVQFLSRRRRGTRPTRGARVFGRNCDRR